ncbi:STM4013/SEN3800 family hydrolase [Chitinivorax sp. B]|uniref:STM4013/SEN3800 family hydrolase n=1 Tax=Chitinivorax sp. B TaxID=2502235 RepID=UPI0010F64233|nr:STM4013/SEN3800 family hydrolase [Chitinivorax sp. B]
MSQFNMNQLVGRYDIVLITLDTLRFDAAQQLFAAGRLPNLSRYLPASGWARRHSPGSFTYAAHHAFFAGFLPTPAKPGRHPRHFAVAFPGSETTASTTCVFDTPDIVSGLAGRGYRTICVGGVGFFNLSSPLGKVLPALFQVSEWCPEFGVTHPNSTANQVACAQRHLADCPGRAFLFINVSAMHQPNRHYLPGCTDDCLDSHMAAMAYVDGALAPLFDTLAKRGGAFVILCADHGTAYGEDGFDGHRIGHPVVWDVPYAEFLIQGQS